MENHLNSLLNVATDAAQAAGKILQQGCGLRQVHAEQHKDVKLQADTESEQLIRTRLGEQTALPIIGEEWGGDMSLVDKDELFWIVDPLDGTFNYLRNIPITCVSIGLCRGLNPILGVIYDFNLDECYTGADGIPLMCNGTPVQPAWANEHRTAALATGFPAGRDFSGRALESFIHTIQKFKKIRMIGSAAMALAYVASGKCDAYYEESIRLWDVAAGLALVKAAGGVIDIQCSDSPAKPLAYNVSAAAKQDWLLMHNFSSNSE